MGEAKRRGTYEQRKALAVKKGNTTSGWWRDNGGLSKRQLRKVLRAMRGGMAKFSPNTTGRG